MLNQDLDSGKVASIEIIRGVAAVMVMTFHYTIETSIHLGSTNFLRQIGKYGHHGVEAFFIISGFVMAHSMSRRSYNIRNFGPYILRRIVRIDIPYMAIIILEIIAIYLVYWTGLRLEVSDRLDWLYIPSHLFYLNGFLNKSWLIPVFWTLAIEFQFYLFLALTFPLLRKGMLLQILILVGGSLMGYFFLNSNYIFYHLPLFAIGIFANFLLSTRHSKKSYATLMIGSIIALIFLFDYNVFIVAIITVSIILFVKKENIVSRFLGKISYSLYLVHVPFGGRILYIGNSYLSSDVDKSILIVVALITTIPVAWLFYIIFEKSSLLLSKKIKYGNKE